MLTKQKLQQRHLWRNLVAVVVDILCIANRVLRDVRTRLEHLNDDPFEQSHKLVLEFISSSAHWLPIGIALNAMIIRIDSAQNSDTNDDTQVRINMRTRSTYAL